MNWLRRWLICLHPSEAHLGAYADGELGGLDAEGVAYHLHRCGRCRSVVECREEALRRLRLAGDEREAEMIESMVAAGRRELERRLGGEGGEPEAMNGIGPGEAEAAGAIFGCRIPPEYGGGMAGPGAGTDRRLDQMCVAMLGSRIVDPNAR